MKASDIGKSGESEAVSYLLSNGYNIIEKNYHSKYGEIDIIAKKGEIIVFIEVKLRRNSVFGNPCEFVSANKIEKIKKTIQLWLIENNVSDTPLRFDVIEIGKINNGISTLNHIKNAYERF